MVLDSDHSKEHVLAELEAYSPLVTSGSYLVVADGVIQSFSDLSTEDWAWNNPLTAIQEFLAKNTDFEEVYPGDAKYKAVSYFTHGFLRRK